MSQSHRAAESESSAGTVQPTRRRVLVQLWRLTGWSLVAGSGALVHHTLSAASPIGRTVSLPSTLVDQARAEGGLVTDDLFLRVVDGEPVALRRRCTHLGCKLALDRDQGVLRCPCHGSRFDLSGAPLGGPASRPLERIALDRHDDTWQALLHDAETAS